MEEERQLTWGEIREIMDNNGVKDSDIVDNIGYWGTPTLPEKAMVHRAKLTDDKYHVTLNFKD